MNHGDRSVRIVATEQAAAAPMIGKCARPDSRQRLRGRRRLAMEDPQPLSPGPAMHRQYMRYGDMRGMNGEDYRQFRSF